MNKVVLVGRLTRDPEARVTNDQKQMTVTRYTLAVDRRGRDAGADFIPCVSFGKSAEFAEKYFRKGMRIALDGRIQTGSYKDREGKTVYTTEVVVDNHEFAQNKSENEYQGDPQYNAPTEDRRPRTSTDDFMVIPDNVDESGLPFN